MVTVESFYIPQDDIGELPKSGCFELPWRRQAATLPETVVVLINILRVHYKACRVEYDQ